MRLPLGTCFVTAAGPCGARTPHPQPRGGSARTLFARPGLGWPPFARRYWGGLCLISSPRGTYMFQFPRLPPTMWVAGPRLLGSPIRAPRDRSPCAAPPGLSRLAAPFVGSLRQGIRRAPFIPSGRSAPPASDHKSVLSRNLFLFALCGSQGALSWLWRATGAGRCGTGRSSLAFRTFGFAFV